MLYRVFLAMSAYGGRGRVFLPGFNWPTALLSSDNTIVPDISEAPREDPDDEQYPQVAAYGGCFASIHYHVPDDKSRLRTTP
jgi:hypothetical protein